MRRKVWQSSASAAKQGGNKKESGQAAAAASAASWVSLYCCCGRNDDRSSMCTSAQIIGSLLVLSVLEIGLGLSSVAVGAVTLVRVRVEAKQELGDSSPFLMCGVCGIFCAKKKSGLIMILFSACCICGLIGGILNIQFLRALTKRSSSLYSLQLASISLACIGISGCTISTWLTCRLASYEQRRMFLEREHSLHHSHEMTEKETAENGGAQMVFNGRV